MVGEARFKLTGSSVVEVKQGMNNLLLRISAEVKTLNSEISRYRLADYVIEMCCPERRICSTIIFSSLKQ